MIEVEGLRKTFKADKDIVAAVDSIGFAVESGQIVTLLGPSGCGKTTTLRMIAGLERPESGRILIGGREVVDAAAGVFVPAHKRDLGMVFQSYAIWPHMSVLENVAYPLEGRGLARHERKTRAMAALEQVQLAHLAERPAPRLSGGQQQRVAIARALVGRPQALLFDEPLSNLDAKLRVEMRNELRRIQRQVGLTSVFVTHDQAEALAISDIIIVMKDGRIVESGKPLDIYRYPRNVFTAQFLGTTNLVPGTVDAIDATAKTIRVRTALGLITGIDPTGRVARGDAVMVSIRPEDLTPADATEAAPDANSFSGQLSFAIFAGTAVEAEMRCGDIVLQCLLNRDADLTPGRALTLEAKPSACLVLPNA